MVKTYDCTSGGAQYCQGCYTMEESKDYKGNPDGWGHWVLREDYDALARVVYEQCSREGCHCPGEIKGECAFCVMSAALGGFVPDAEGEHE